MLAASMAGEAPGAREPLSIRPRTMLVALLALLAGCAITWVDTRPGWDDTAITAAALLIAGAASAYAGLRWWLATALIAVPLVVVERGGGNAVLLAVAFTAAGAIGGALVRRATRR